MRSGKTRSSSNIRAVPDIAVVLYNGDRTWNAKLDVRELIDVSALDMDEDYLPRFKYLLIDSTH
jgi:hypothetical protein